MAQNTETLGNGQVINFLMPRKSQYISSIPAWVDPQAFVWINPNGTLGSSDIQGEGNLSTTKATYTDAQTLSSPTSINSYVQFDPATRVRDGGDITIEGNVFIVRGDFHPFMEVTSSSDRFIMGFQTGRNKFIVYHNGSAPVQSVTFTPPTNQWVHIAYVFDSTATQWKIYVAGNLIATVNRPAGAASPGVTYIGSDNAYIDRYQIMPYQKYTTNFTPNL